MSTRCGIVGLPNAGKSTLFRALTEGPVAVGPYPFTTVEPNVGVVRVPDERLERIARLVRPPEVVPATLRFVDIAGLARGASRGEGLGNRFLAHIREVDVVVEVVRCFRNPEVAHVEGEVDPVRDAEVVELELALADLETVEGRLRRLQRSARTADDRRRLELCERLREALARGRPARALGLSPEERRLAGELQLLTMKPLVYVANVEEVGQDEGLADLRRRAGQTGTPLIVCPAKLEAELLELPPAEREQMRRELGLGRSPLEELVRTCYRLLDLITFYTAVGRQLRAWPVPRGTRAPQAAGRVHSDMERGFIRAEVLALEDLEEAGSWERARQLGRVRAEGRDYEVQDGDIVQFRFRQPAL